MPTYRVRHVKLKTLQDLLNTTYNAVKCLFHNQTNHGWWRTSREDMALNYLLLYHLIFFQYYRAVYVKRVPNDVINYINATWTRISACNIARWIKKLKMTNSFSNDSSCNKSDGADWNTEKGLNSLLSAQSTVSTISFFVYSHVISPDSLQLDTKTFYNQHYCQWQARENIWNFCWLNLRLFNNFFFWGNWIQFFLRTPCYQCNLKV